MKLKDILIAACTTALLGFTAARAAVEMRIDLQIDGTGASNGGTWNVLSTKSTTVKLLDLNGNASGVSMSYNIDGFGVGTGL